MLGKESTEEAVQILKIATAKMEVFNRMVKSLAVAFSFGA